MKKIKVQFINDDDVTQLVKLGKNKRVPTKQPPLNESLINPEYSLKGEEKDHGMFFRPTALLEDSNESHFNFKTPTKEGGMFEKASSASRQTSRPRTPSTPKYAVSPLADKNKTPRSRLRCSRSLVSSPKTPSQDGKLRSTSKTSTHKSTRTSRAKKSAIPEAETPFTFRNRVNLRIRKIISDDSESELDLDNSDLDANFSPSDYDSQSDEDDWAEPMTDFNDNTTPSKASKKFPFGIAKTPTRTPRRRKLKSQVDVDAIESSNEYFIHNSDTCVTSDATLSRLEVPRLAPEVLKSILKDSYSVSHPAEKEDLLLEHSRAFESWVVGMREGYSIFLCGVGSKKTLLSNFQTACLDCEDHIVINGFFPSLTLKSILVSILEDIMQLKSHPQGINDQLKTIREFYSNCPDPLFLIIHNLDGPMLRCEKAQFAISRLASSPNIHVIASLDHINSPIMFNAAKLSQYNPLWWDATTFAPYVEETSYENSLLVQQTGALALSSLNHVFKSLTPNTKGLFLLLARHQLKYKEDSNYIGLAFMDLYQKCREAFLVNSDLTLRTLLTEFRDHKLVQIKKAFDGAEMLLIPLTHSILSEFVDEHADLCP